MRDYVLTDRRVPVTEVPASILREFLAEVPNDDTVGQFGQCTGRELRERILIELRARELGLV